MSKSKDNCVFYDKYFLDDLENHKIIQSGIPLVVYTNNNNTIPTIMATNPITISPQVISVIQQGFNENIAYLPQSSLGRIEENVWYPVFVHRFNNGVKNRFLFKSSAAQNLVLGIDQAISFNGLFKSWNISGSSSIAVDWVVTSQLPSYLVEYGLLCWVQKSSYKAKSISIDNIPVGAVIRFNGSLSYTETGNNISKTTTISVNDHLVKLDTNTLQIINNQEIIFENNTFNFTSKNKIFDIDKYININFPRNRGETDDNYNRRIDNVRKHQLIFQLDVTSPPGASPINIIDKDTIIYISKGDVYSYYEDSETKALVGTALGLPSLTYVSSTLFAEYREIYNLLTMDYKKNLKSTINQAQYRLLQKIAKFLSSHPAVDRTTISVLLSEEAKLIVDKFIKKTFGSIDQERTELIRVINELSLLFRDLNFRVKNTNISGYCFNHADIAINLMSKYEPYLNINTPTTLFYKKQLPYGPHIKINQNIISKCSVNLKNTMVYNNFIANIGPYTLESQINPSKTYFIVTDTRNPANKVDIPLWDIKKKKLLTNKLEVTAGADFIIRYVSPEGQPLPVGTEISYSLSDKDLGQIEEEILDREKLQTVWSKISGPDCLRFSDTNLTSIRNQDGLVTNPGDSNLRFEESTEPKPTLYIKKPGRYILRLKIITSFGVYYDRVTVYVVDASGQYEPGKVPTSFAAAKKVIIEPTDGLVVICPNLREFAMGKQGVFWPIYSDASVYSEEDNPYGSVASFGGLVRKYKIKDNQITELPCNFSLTYRPENTIMQISRIKLSHMMDNKPNCYNCDSFFQNIVDNEGFIIDAQRSFSLENPDTGTIVDFYGVEDVSTDRTRVITYGNHSPKTISDLGVTIPNHPHQLVGLPLRGAVQSGIPLPPITGLDVSVVDKRGSPTHLCHLKNVDNEKSLIFERGCFHPSTGWIVDPASTGIPHIPYKNPLFNIFLNKSAVTNLTPERRKTFKFKGPGFFNLNNLSAERTNNTEISNANLFFSNITLALKKEAQDTPNNSDDAVIQQEKREISDHQQNLGYRNAIGSLSANQEMPNDEFETSLRIDPNGPVPSTDYCVDGGSTQNYDITYSFTRKGGYIPKPFRTPRSRFTRDISTAKIEDIEVQIDFMNYVNTKNLIIWLDVKPCSYVSSELDKGKDRWFFTDNKIYNSVYDNKSYMQTKTKIDNMQESPLKKYLKALFEMNDNPALSGTAFNTATSTPTPESSSRPRSNIYRLYLLNQEHVEGNKFNFSLKFTDNIDKYTQPFDNNNRYEYLDPKMIKSVEKDGIIHLLPTVAASGYNDYEINFFRQIIQTNNLHTTNNRFMKFSGMPLFQDSLLLARDSTTFSLGIAVLNESDSMEIIDNISNLDSKNAISRTIDTTIPTVINNSTCCWYLILHINNNGSQKFLPNDVLGDIQYGSLLPTIYGHNFIATLNDDKKYLLPPININAPYFSNLDADICKYSKQVLNTPKFERLEFNFLPVILIGGAASAVGVLGQIASVDAQGAQLTREIVSFFDQTRKAQQSSVFTDSLHISKYDRFQFGSAGKILLSVSKDNLNWFKLEASIFRYNNCPIIQKRKLNYLKLNYRTSKTLSIFSFNRIDSIIDLINQKDVKIVSIPLESAAQIATLDRKTVETAKKSLETQAESIRASLVNQPVPNPAVLQNLSRIETLINLHNETLDGMGLKIRESDIVNIKKTELTSATSPQGLTGYNLFIDGLYVVQENNVVRKIIEGAGQFSISKLTSQLTKSSLIDFNLILISNPNPAERITKPFVIQNYLISIDTLRPYYFFNKDDIIVTIRPISDYLSELRRTGGGLAADAIEQQIANLKRQLDKLKQNNINGNNNAAISQLEQTIWDRENLLNVNTIVAKGYIFDGTSHKTILELRSPIIGNSISIAPEQSDVILVYDKKYTTIENEEKYELNRWTNIESSNSIILKNKTQEKSISTFGEGLYGTGSLLVNPPLIPNKFIENEIQSFSEKINTKNNFYLTKTSVDIYLPQGGIHSTGNPVVDMSGYDYTYNDYEYIQSNIKHIEGRVNDRISQLFTNSRIFSQNRDHFALTNIKAPIFKRQDILPSGEMIFDNDISFKYPSYKLSPSDVAIINARLQVILMKRTIVEPKHCDSSPQRKICLQAYWDNIPYVSLFIEDLYYYLENVEYTNPINREKNKREAHIRLQSLLTEVATILYQCERGGATRVPNNPLPIPVYVPSISPNECLPTYTIKISTEPDGSLLFEEKAFAQDDYWINIDPEQGCSRDLSETPKILIQTKYTCAQFNNFVTLNAQNICPYSMLNPKDETDILNGVDENFKWGGNEYTYTPSERQIAIQMSKYPGLSWNWPSATRKDLYIVRREFFINHYGKEKNQLVKSEETYLLPILLPDITVLGETLADGDIKNKVKDIFNLDTTQKLYVKFKRIPRKLSKYDPFYDKYVPNYLGQLTKSVAIGPGGPVDTTLQFWHCIDYLTGMYIDPPKYFKWLNEMIYRAYYGSTDAVEHRGKTLSESKDTFDWIPHDYM